MAWVVQLAGLAASAIQQNQQNQKAKKAANDQKQISQQQEQQALALQPVGQHMLAQGEAAFNPVFSNYLRLATGDRNSILQSLYPEYSALQQQYGQAIQSANEFAPRGGGRLAAVYGNAPFAMAGQRANLAYGARANALGGLGALGNSQTASGLGALGAMFGGLQGAAGTGSNAYNMMMMNRANASANSASLGSSLADIYNNYTQWQAGRGAGTTTSSGAGSGVGLGPWTGQGV